MSTLTAPISAGELIDKLTILEIKQQQITAPDKLNHINHELNLLKDTWKNSEYVSFDIHSLQKDLHAINQQLWDIEDRIRIKESEQSFDDEFISLARSVYFKNDERARLKSEINRLVGSPIAEQKSYADYRK